MSFLTDGTHANLPSATVWPFLLMLKESDLYYKKQKVIPVEEVDAYLRKEFYSKDSDVPLTRDGAWHILNKRDVVGITRARLMKFLKSQSAVESVRNAPPKPKHSGGVPVKKFHFETDLVFIRKPDFVKISKNTDTPRLVKIGFRIIDL